MTTEPGSDWASALDRLEMDVVAIERMVEDPSQPAPAAWTAPGLGPLPAHLVERAIALQTRQLAAERALAEQLDLVARQQEFTSRVDRATRSPGTPLYLDVSA